MSVGLGWRLSSFAFVHFVCLWSFGTAFRAELARLDVLAAGGADDPRRTDAEAEASKKSGVTPGYLVFEDSSKSLLASDLRERELCAFLLDSGGGSSERRRLKRD